MTEPVVPDPRPRPQYGEYAPPGYVSPVPEQPMTPVRQSEPAGARADTRRWDRVLTLALLVFGAFGTSVAVFEGLNLGDLLSQSLAMQGFDGFAGDAVVPGIVMWVGHVVLYLAAVVLAIGRLRAGRSAFWVPLLFGFLAIVLFFGAGTAALLSDPDFVAKYMPGS